MFDEAAPLDPAAASFNYERIVNARRNLSSTLNGYGSSGTQLFAALGLTAPTPATAKPKGGKAKETRA